MVVGDVPGLKIVSDELWTKVKTRQMEVEASFSHTTTNRLNRTHRPSYLLSGLLECQHCSGPYAIMAKDRYGCTNSQKKLPIEHLGDIVCPNSKIISWTPSPRGIDRGRDQQAAVSFKEEQ